MTQLLATFTTRDEAGRAAQRLTHDFPDVDVTVGDQEDALDALAVNQRAEMEESIVTTSVGLWSGPMARGALVWGVVGLVAGAVLAMPLLLFFDFPDGQEWLFVAAVAVAGALGLSSATFLLGGAHRAEKELETTPEDPWAVLRVGVPEVEADEVTHALAEAGARSIRPGDQPVQRRATGDVETPRRMHGRPEPS